MGRHRSMWGRSARQAVLVVAVAGTLGGFVLPAAAAPPVAAASDIAAAEPASANRAALVYAAPVDRPVVDGFRMDAGPYGAGNRGLEYGTVRGDPVRAVAAGRVAFAGPVAGRLVVAIEHPDGRRSTLTHLARIDVAVDEVVARGTSVGLAASGLHLGVIEDGRYIDPASLFARGSWWARLVPIPTERRGR